MNFTFSQNWYRNCVQKQTALFSDGGKVDSIVVTVSLSNMLLNFWSGQPIKLSSLNLTSLLSLGILLCNKQIIYWFVCWNDLSSMIAISQWLWQQAFWIEELSCCQLQGVVHPKMKLGWKFTHPQTIQDVDVVFFSLEPVWRNLALHHLKTKWSSAVNGCRQNESQNCW